MIASDGSYYKIANGSIDSAGLPSEYQQVEYIEGTGTQWIDTQIKYKENMSFEVQFMELAIPTPETTQNRTHIFGCHNGTNRVRLRRLEPNTLYILYGNNGESRNVVSPVAYSMLNNIYNVYFSPTNIKVKYNDILIHDWDISNDNIKDINDNITLFYHVFDPTNKFIGRFYFVKIYENGSLSLNLIPCYRLSDNEIGMYDTVNGVFYTNQGTGTFVKGPNVYNRYIVKEFDRPYISGHVTDGSSTFMFKVNNNVNITVPVDSDGNWKWYQDRAITSLNRMICFTSTTYTDNIDYLEINANLDNCTNLGVAIALSTLEKVVIKSKTALLKDISYLAQDCVNLKQFYAPNINLGSGSNIGSMFLRCANLEIVDLRNSKIITAGATTMFSGCNKLNTLLVDSIKANTKFSSSNVLPKQFIINIINAAEASITYTLHATPYAKCASGGEWYSDIQAAIDAKALEGYTVTLISA